MLSKNSDIGSRGDCEKVALLRARLLSYIQYIRRRTRRSVTVESRSKTSNRFVDNFDFSIYPPQRERIESAKAFLTRRLKSSSVVPGTSLLPDLLANDRIRRICICISCTIPPLVPPRYTSIILAYHEIIRPVVRRRSDRSISFVYEPVRLKRFHRRFF